MEWIKNWDVTWEKVYWHLVKFQFFWTIFILVSKLLNIIRPEVWKSRLRVCPRIVDFIFTRLSVENKRRCKFHVTVWMKVLHIRNLHLCICKIPAKIEKNVGIEMRPFQNQEGLEAISNEHPVLGMHSLSIHQLDVVYYMVFWIEFYSEVRQGDTETDGGIRHSALEASIFLSILTYQPFYN